MRTILSLVLGAFIAFPVNDSYGQCTQFPCPADVIIAADSTGCSAIVNYEVPQTQSNCLQTDSFTYTGNMQYFIVPVGIDTVTARVYGAQGGANWVNNTNYGGFSAADIPVTAGDTLFLYVGGQPAGITGGWNGGGAGETAGAGGGGASDIRMGGKTFSDRILVAGGGGGGGYWSGQEIVGGYGGGLVGGNGYRSTTTNAGGDGGTQTSSGDGTCVTPDNPVCAGGFGYGGSPSSCGCEGYGGGGGWYGGAGSGNCRGGGGGSGYAAAFLTNVDMNNGIRVGHGAIVLTYTRSGGGLPGNLVSGLGSGATFPVGITTEKYEIKVSRSDTLRCSFNVIVRDSTPPSLNCPADVNVTTEVVSGIAPVVSDNCGDFDVHYTFSGATTGSGTGDAGASVFMPGTTVVTYTATDTSGNSDTCSFKVIYTPVGIREMTFGGEQLLVYPNPNNGQFNIDLTAFSGGKMKVRLLTMTGQVSYEGELMTGRVNEMRLEGLKKGLYLLEINSLPVSTPVMIR